VYVDALNVAWWAGAPPSLRLPLTLLAALLERGYTTTLFFDASAHHHFAAEAAACEALLHLPRCVQTPSGRCADGELLRQARRTGALVVSRDHFRDHRRRYRKLIDDPTRRCEGFLADDALHLPGLDLIAPLPPTAEAALRALWSAPAP
jgi:hypothetical protein